MALMLAKLYTALREAGADDDKAREAAEEVASFESRLANVEASLMVLKWMVGFNLILTVASGLPTALARTTSTCKLGVAGLDDEARRNPDATARRDLCG
jgi:hypothetical protein